MPKDRIPNTAPPQRRAEYVARLNRVLDYVDENIDGDLSLQRLAGVACCSPFHFHRMFRALMGETVNQFIRRLRAEKAAVRLTRNPGESITEIALDCGFSSSETFARTFRDVFRMSASEWRAGGYKHHESKIRNANSKDGQTLSNIGQYFVVSSFYIDPGTNNLRWRMTMKKDTKQSTIEDFAVEVRQLPEMHVAYVRHIGPYKGNAELFGGLIQRLMTWAGPRGLVGTPQAQLLAVYHDDPEVTEEAKLRTSMCLTVPKDTEVDGEVGQMTLAAGQYAVGHFELAQDEYEQAWNALYGGWLPDSGFQPDDGPCYEVYKNDPKQHPEGKCLIDICIPVKPL